MEEEKNNDKKKKKVEIYRLMVQFKNFLSRCATSAATSNCILEVFDKFRRVGSLFQLLLDERRELALLIFSTFLFNRVN